MGVEKETGHLALPLARCSFPDLGFIEGLGLLTDSYRLGHAALALEGLYSSCSSLLFTRY